MVAGALKKLSRLARWPSVTGPIFGKELRTSSRRKRNYVLRSVYLGLMILFIAGVWQTAVGISSSFAWSVAQMAIAGRAIIVTIIWFQFCAMQLIVLIMLSTAISEEIYRRTLGVLMTTPINSFQIVMGKLFSKLLQLLILLAISLPLLALVRVFGGVPWEYVVAGLCITVTGLIFTGSVSLFYSITSRRAYLAILKAFFTLLALFFLIPILAPLLLRGDTPGWLMIAFLYANPSWSLAGAGELLLPGSVSQAIPFHWRIHCLVMLGMSAAVLGVCVLKVRSVGLRQATGEAGLFTRRRRRQTSAVPGGAERAAGRVRRLTGSPVIWRELRTPMFRSRRQAVIGTAATIIVMGITYLAAADYLDGEFAHVMCVLILLGVGTLATSVLAATSITSEKEARSLPILLCTTLSDWHIIAGKAVGVFRRCMPVWLLLLAHLVLFSLIGYMHPIALIHIGLLVGWLVLFLTGTGLYFSSRFRRTTAAVVANIGLGMALWIILPVMALLLGGLSGWGGDFLATVANANPAFQAGLLTTGSAGGEKAGKDMSALEYPWLDLADWLGGEGSPDAAETAGRMTVYVLLYGLAGLAFAARAKSRLRRGLF